MRHVAILLGSLMLLANVLAFGLAVPPGNGRDLGLSWTREVVESQGLVGAYTSIQLAGPSEKPYIAYQDVGSRDLRFAYVNGTGWHRELVDSEGSTGFLPSLAISHGRTTISYGRLDQGAVMFRELVGASWVPRTIWSGGSAGASSTTVGDDGRRYVAFDGGRDGLRLATENATSWDITGVDPTVANVAGVSAAYRGGTLAVAYTTLDLSTGLGIAKVAVGNGRTWSTQTVANETGSSVSIAFNSTGIIHLAFGKDARLVHAYRDGTNWTQEPVDSGSRVGDIQVGFQMAIGRDDKPRIAYLVTDTFRLMYAVREPQGWAYSKVDEQVNRGLWVSLAVDSGDNPHIAYEDSGLPPGSTEDLWYATARPASNDPPVANAGTSYTGKEGDTITFTAAASTDPNGDPLTFRWDYTADGTWDTGWSSEPTASMTFGDDFAGNVRVEASDGTMTSTAEAPVTIQNVAPALDDLQVYVVADLTLRVAGEKWHDVRMDLVWNGDVTGTARVVRYPGSPDRQTATITGGGLQLVRAFVIVVYYTPADDPVNGQPNGANPVWVILTMPDGSEVRLHHTFNVQHPSTWTWTIDDVRPYFVDQRITFDATASDVGSDDLTFAWAFGDGTAGIATTFFNNGVSPDPDVSPEVNPITARDVQTHAFAVAGTYTVTLTVTDDDGGMASRTFSLTVGG